MFLSGKISQLVADAHPSIGFMYAFNGAPNRHVPGVPFGLDNGCYAQPEKFSEAGFFDWLEGKSPHRAHCLFVTARDAVGDAETTLALSAPMLPEIRAHGYPAALVFQDGLERLDVPWDAFDVPWDAFDVAFIGGSTAWKLGPAWELAAEARRKGKRTHMGRVNSLRRFQACAQEGFDSVDGTFLAFGPDRRLPELVGWLNRVSAQPGLFS